MSTHLLTTSSLLMVQEGSRSLKAAASVKSEWQSGKICPSCWKKKHKICLPCLPLSEIMCSSKHICNSGYQKVFESACLTVEHVTHWALPCSSDLMFIYCIEQHQFLKCIGPVGARASSDTVPVPVVLSTQYAKTLGFHLHLKLKNLVSTAEL